MRKANILILSVNVWILYYTCRWMNRPHVHLTCSLAILCLYNREWHWRTSNINRNFAWIKLHMEAPPLCGRQCW
jgi:hypothetical protein